MGVRKTLSLVFLIIFCLLFTTSVLAESPEKPGDPPMGNERIGPIDKEEWPEPTTITERLAAPPLPSQPSQADFGAQVYYQVCMACHGDRGQGLTEEWRAVWEEDSYCWASKCHGPNHPEWGFEFPKVSSPVIGPGTLTRFQDAQALHTYITDTMPWWNPGYLKKAEFWQLTAFLVREHGGLPDGVVLSAGNATVFQVNPTAPIPADVRPQVLFVSAVLAAAAGLLAIQNRMH